MNKFFLFYFTNPKTNKTDKFSVTVENCIVNSIGFTGKGCYGRSDDAADDVFIDSFYKIVKIHYPQAEIKSRYLAPHETGKDYSYTISYGDKSIKHCMHKGKTTFYDASNLSLQETLLHFMTEHKNNISFPSFEDQKKCVELLGNGILSDLEVQKVQKIREVMNRSIPILCVVDKTNK